MPTLDAAPPPFVKIMVIGDSGSGKTGALVSLARAGYNLRILDMDDGLAPLAQLIKAEDASLLARVGFMTFRDNYKNNELVRPAKAYLGASRTMDKWEDDTVPSAWGHEYVYVVDSLTLLARAAFNQAISLAPACKDPRQWYASAQQAVENFLACVTSPNFGTNVVILTHINEIEMADGTSKGFPSAVGKALSRHIGKYLNDLFVVETRGSGNNVRRIIRTVPNGITDAKTSLVGLPSELPINTGLADIFKALSN